MIESIESIMCTCDKCKYHWVPKGGKAPKVCPKCKSHNWNENKEGVVK